MFGIFKFLTSNLGQSKGYQNTTPTSYPVSNDKAIDIDSSL